MLKFTSLAVKLLFAISLLLPGTGRATAHLALMDKVTFRVDMRLQTVSGGVYIAGNFMDQVGLAIWTQVPMCDIGNGIYEISFTGIDPGTYQYKFLNGPGGWEFNGFGGPCTNPADNNNRWLNYGGGMHVEGPWCFSTCDLFCAGMGNPGSSDTTPPTIDQPAPANTSITCGSPLPTATPLDASDGCDFNATTTTGMPTDDLAGLGPCGTGNVLRTWEAEDCSGNTTSVAQTITITDNLPPTIDAPVPGNVTVACGNLPSAVSLPASDACDANVTSTGMPTDDLTGLSPCGTGNIARTWQASDCAGNTVSASQTITVQDNVPPVLTNPAPADITVACGNAPAPAPLAASDACDPNVTTTGMPTDDLTGLSPCGTGQIIRTWQVSDCTGNSFSASQTITVQDNAAPILVGTLPADVTVSCGNVPPGNPLAASDACDPGVTTTGPPTDDNSGINACGTGQIIRTWEVSDCTGNTFSASQTITVQDNAGPVISNTPPANVTLVCGDPLPVGQPLPATDDCDPGVTATDLPSDDLSGLGPCGTGQVIRTWTATDCANNSNTFSQTIAIVDATPPVITDPVPANTTTDCTGMPQGLPLSAFDACDPGVLLTDFPSDDLSSLNGCGLGTVVRTWSVSDCAGNTFTATQLIEIQDNNPPQITAQIPADLTVSCGNIPPAMPLPALDDCDQSVVSTGPPSDDLSGLNACGTGVVIRTWSVTDCAGNTFSATQTITVEEDEPMMLTVPADVSLDCGNLPPASAADASVSGSCTVPVVTYLGETVNGSGCPYQVIRTWSASDACGNLVTASQTITVTDTQAPVFAAPPANATVCQGAVPAPAPLTWTDNCDGTGDVLPTDTSDGMTDPETITRTWAYTDDCGNLASISQTITVISAPAANAGSDQTICGSATITLSGNVAGGFNSLIWTTNGDGIFQNPTNPNATYTPGSNDLANGSATIFLTAQTNGTGLCSQTSDSLLAVFVMPPSANAGPAQTITCAATQVTLNGSGSSSGTGFAYGWNGPGITAANANLQNPQVSLPGTYTLTVTETNSGQNCSATASVMVFENTAQPIASAGPDLMLTCANPSVALDGSGTVSGTGIAYLWDGPGINGSNESLPNPTVSQGGMYFLTVTDAENGCSASDSTQVTPDANLPVSDPGPDQTLDCDHPTALLDGSNSTSGPGILLQWTGPNAQPLGNGPTLTIAQAGIYNLTVNDTNNGCEITASVEVFSDTTPPTADAGPDTLLTCGQPSITLGGNSSTGPGLTYEWTLGGQPVGDSPTLTTSQPGLFTLTIVDAGNGCSASDQVTVSQNADLPTAEAGPDQQLGCGNPSAMLDGSGSSTGPGMVYAWSGPGFSSQEIAPQVGTTGTYFLTVTNTLTNCSATDSVTVTADASLPTADAGADMAITCFASQIVLDGANSSQGATIGYEWQNSAGLVVGNGPTLTVGAPGLYTLWVTNAQNGCSASDAVTVGLDTLPPIADAGTDGQFTCTQTIVALDGSGSSTGPQISYLWTGPGVLGLPDSVVVQAGAAGTYTLTVTDLENGCSATDEAVISQNPNVPTATATADGDITCLTGSVTLMGGASVPNAEYTWSGPGISAATANQQNPVTSEPGTYTLVVTDPATGCDSPPSIVEVADLREIPLAVVTVTGSLDCQTPAVLLDGSGSAQGNDIVYQWLYEGNPLPTGLTATWMAENAGMYELVVGNTATGCQSSAAAEVLDFSYLPQAEINGPNLINCLEETIILAETAGSASPNVSLAWATVGGNILQQNQNQVTVNAGGTYTVTVTDMATGCTNTADFLVTADLEAPAIVLSPTFLLGCGQTSVVLDATVTANTTDLLYEWTGGGGFASNLAAPVVSLPGMYALTITNNGNGCTALATTTVNQAADPHEVFFTATPPTCHGAMDGVLQVDSVIGGGSALFYFILENADTVLGLTPQFSGLAAGDYSLTVFDLWGCAVEVGFSMSEPPPFEVSLGQDVGINLGETVQLSAIVSAPVSEYIWTNGGSLSCGDCPDPLAQPVETTLYTLTATNAAGCEATDDILVTVNTRPADIFHPNVFSPNNDGINDVFTLFGGSQLVRIKQLLVFDRWGAKVYVATDLPPNDSLHGWDGTHKGQPMGSGVYVFYAEVVMVSGEVVPLEGEVVLVR